MMRGAWVMGVAVGVAMAGALAGCGGQSPTSAPTPVKIAAGVPSTAVASPEPTPVPATATPPVEEPTPTPIPSRVATPPRTTVPAATRPAEPTQSARGGGGGVAPQGKGCPDNAPIKGNQGSRSTKEWIYHRPGGGSYKVTVPEECFASASDAEDAGYRAAKN